MAAVDLQDAFDHLQQRNIDAAISTLEETVDTLPAHLAAYVLLGRAYEAAGRWADALQCWETARVLMPNGPVAQEGKARVLRKMEEEEASPAADLGMDVSSTPESSGDTDTTSPQPDAASSEPEPPSELEELRQRTEAEARQGGARPGLRAQADDDSGPKASTSGAGDDTPEERVEQLSEDDDFDELDRLIDELESARIEPSPGPADAPEPDVDDEVDDLVSETLARIYETQDEYQKAAQVYVKLASQEPNKAREYLQRAAEMRERAEEAAAAGEGN